MLVGQAVLESGWGNSRFAIEGKNLFGIQYLNQQHIYYMLAWKNGKVGVLEF